MNKFILAASLFVAFNSTSQITLSNTDFATGGDTVRMSQASDNGFDYATTGAGYTWDFSALVANAQIVKNFRAMSSAPAFVQFLFGPFAPTRYQASYYIESTAIPVAQLTSFLPVSIDNIFQFSRKSNDSLTSVGFSMTVSGTDIPFKSDTIETRYDFPLIYGNTHFSRGYTYVDMNPIIDAKWIQHRVRSTSVDGYGSVTTPYGTFNALRIKHDITEIDSLYFVLPIVGGTWIPLPIPDSHEYEWWTNNEKEPILRFTTNDVLGNEVVTAIEYRDIYLGLDAGIAELSFDMKVFPNPVSNELTITSATRMKHVKIVDATGKLVYDKDCGNVNSLAIDVSQFTPGTYQLQVNDGVNSALNSFVKR